MKELLCALSVSTLTSSCLAHTKGWAFQPPIHRNAYIYTQIYTISPLYCMSGCMADSTTLMILHNAIMSLSQAWDVFAPFQVHSSRTSLCMHLVLVYLANNTYTKVWQKLFCKMTLAHLSPCLLQRYTWQNKSWHVDMLHISSMKTDVFWKVWTAKQPFSDCTYDCYVVNTKQLLSPQRILK